MTEEIDTFIDPDSDLDDDSSDDIPMGERIPFRREDLVNAHLLRSTTLKEELIEEVENSLLYESAQRALKVLIKNYFNSTWFLANLEKGGKDSGGNTDEMLSARLRFEIDLISASASMMKSDVNSPELLSIVNAIRSQYKIAILSRAKGPNRERLVNKMTSIETILTKKDGDRELNKKKERKGMLG